MRMIVLLIAMVIIALVMTRQIGSPPGVENPPDIEDVPQLPSAPDGLEEFGQDMADVMQESADRRDEQMDEQTR